MFNKGTHPVRSRTRVLLSTRVSLLPLTLPSPDDYFEGDGPFLRNFWITELTPTLSLQELNLVKTTLPSDGDGSAHHLLGSRPDEVHRSRNPTIQ